MLCELYLHVGYVIIDLMTSLYVNDPRIIMECQVVVVGDAKVGKTALLHRLTQNEFLEVRRHLQMTSRQNIYIVMRIFSAQSSVS